jgi:hypothetical protein
LGGGRNLRNSIEERNARMRPTGFEPVTFGFVASRFTCKWLVFATPGSV